MIFYSHRTYDPPRLSQSLWLGLYLVSYLVSEYDDGLAILNTPTTRVSLVLRRTQQLQHNYIGYTACTPVSSRFVAHASNIT